MCVHRVCMCVSVSVCIVCVCVLVCVCVSMCAGVVYAHMCWGVCIMCVYV